MKRNPKDFSDKQETLSPKHFRRFRSEVIQHGQSYATVLLFRTTDNKIPVQTFDMLTTSIEEAKLLKSYLLDMVEHADTLIKEWEKEGEKP